MLTRLVAIVVISIGTTAIAGPSTELCGHGKPVGLDLFDAASDRNASIVVGRVTAQHVSGNSFDERVGTIEVDVSTVVRGARATHVSVPAVAPGCTPKSGCMPSVFEDGKVGATVLVACVVPPSGAPRVALVPGNPPVPDDMRRCVAIADSAPHGAAPASDAHVTALAAAYIDGDTLAKSCAAHTVCDAAHRAVAVRVLVQTTLAPKVPAETRLDLAQGLAAPVSAAAALFACTTTPTLFRADLGGTDPSNALIARTMLEGMLAATDPHHRLRWANQLWGLLIDWRDKPDERTAALYGLPTSLAERSVKMLRSLGGSGGADESHYQELAKIIATANKP